jgi:GTPase involved in cell partitioning and DNA repair
VLQTKPRYAQPGLPGSEMDAKVLADVGLVGFQMLENQHYCLF